MYEYSVRHASMLYLFIYLFVCLFVSQALEFAVELATIATQNPGVKSSVNRGLINVI